MASATVVKFLADKLGSTLEEKLKEEVSLVVKFKKEFESIYDELAHVKFMLKDAGEHSNSESMANWVKNLRDVLTDAMDLVEECQEADNLHLHASDFQRRISEHPVGRKINYLYKMYHWILFRFLSIQCRLRSIQFRLHKGREIQDLQKRINKINHTGNEYVTYLKSFVDVNTSSQLDRRTPISTLVKHVEIVGIHPEIEAITDKILHDPPIIAVWGMGGLGKTRLVKHVFHSKKVKNHFKHRIWLPVSEKFKIDDLLHAIAQQIELPGEKLRIMGSHLTIQLPNDYHHKLTELSTEGLRARIHRFLGEGEKNDILEQKNPSLFDQLLSYFRKKPSLFVLDDVWDKDVLEQIGLAFQRQNNQNKIVVITRDKGICSALGTQSYTHEKKCLNDAERLELFCRHAFSNSKLPEDLESLSPDILQKCTTLPKAVEAIATSMAGVSITYSHWEMALRGLNKADILNKHVMPTLRSSYNALPHHLKACFLYFASFPPNTKIKSECLVYAWLANFRDYTSDQAWDYVKELVDRCVIKASNISVDGRVKFCEMQEFFYDLAVSESNKEATCLLDWGEELKEFPVEKCKNARRISLAKTHIPRIKNTIKCPDLRILSLRDNSRLASISASFFDKLKCLAVLDLSKTGIKSLPNSIGNLKRLKFLNLFQTKIEELPKSLSGLRSLLFLDVGLCEHLRRLHSGIGEHASMEYLNVNDCRNLESLPSGISKLRRLQTLRLKGVILNSKVAAQNRKMAAEPFQWSGFKDLIHIQHLSLTFNTETSLSEGFLSLQSWPSMKKMRILSLQYLSSGDECCTLPQGLGIMGNLERLRLQRLRVPPPASTFWEYQLHSLKELTLEGDDCYEGSYYKGIEKIPNLIKLSLLSNEKCRNLPKKFGEKKAFRKLEKLIIKDFKNLKEFPPLQDNTMPLLKYLQITNCSQMDDMPTGLEKLKSLEKMRLNRAMLKRNQSTPFVNASKILMKKVSGWEFCRHKIKNASGDPIEIFEEADERPSRSKNEY